MLPQANSLSKIIPLTQGEYAIVDHKDYVKLKQYKWHVLRKKTNKYAIRRNPEGKPKHILMHREILGCKKGELTDHINGNGLDNRRSNLRKCNSSESNRNVGMRNHNTSGYMGVHRHENAWCAGIRVNGKHIHLGSYQDPKEAALAYNKAAVKYHGEFATLNEL